MPVALRRDGSEGHDGDMGGGWPVGSVKMQVIALTQGHGGVWV